MTGGFSMDDYVDVAERIRQFYERFPDGRLTTGTPPFVQPVGDRAFVVYHARAFRTHDDPLPGDGWAWEPIPGPTQFTRDSELMNAETAAWGRAIVAVGFETKKIASAQEVRNRQSSQPPTAAPGPNTSGTITEPQQKRLFAIAREKDVDAATVKHLVKTIAGVDSTAAVPKAKYDELVAAVEAQGVPF